MDVVAPIDFVVVRGELSVELPAGSAPSAAPALALVRIPVTAKIVLDPAVLEGGGGLSKLVHLWSAVHSHRISHRKFILGGGPGESLVPPYTPIAV